MTSAGPRAECAQILQRHTGGVFAAAFDATGRYCMTGGADRIIRLWNPSTGLLIQTYAGHGRQVLAVAAGTDGSFLLSGGGDRSAILWDVATVTVTRKLGGPHGHTERINAVAFAGQTDSVLVTGSYDATVRLWDGRSGSSRPVQTLAHARDSVSAIVVADTQIIAASIDGHLRTYDVRAGQLGVDDLFAPVANIALSRDGNCVLVACLGSPMCLLDKAAGTTLSTYTGNKTSEFRIDCAVLCDDALVVAGSDDGRVCLWDIVDGGDPVLRIGPDDKGAAVVGAVAAHPSQRLLLTGNHDGVVKLWKVLVD